MARCGTPQGHKQHKANGEEPCRRCRYAIAAERTLHRSRHGGKVTLTFASLGELLDSAMPDVVEWIRESTPAGTVEAALDAFRRFMDEPLDEGCEIDSPARVA